MSKRKRKRPAQMRAGVSPARRPASSPPSTSESTPRRTGEAPAARKSPRGPSVGRARTGPSGRPGRAPRAAAGPPIGASLAHGLHTVGSSPPLLVGSFLAVFVLWLLYSALGSLLVVSPGFISMILAVPPLSSLLDLQFVVASTRLFDPTTTLLLAAVLVLLRAWFTAMLIGLV